MNLCSALTAYYFFDNKPEALPVYVEKTKQLELFAYWSYPELEYGFIPQSIPKKKYLHTSTPALLPLLRNAGINEK